MKKNKMPLILIIAAIFVYGGLALAILFLAMGLGSNDDLSQSFCYNLALITVTVGVTGSYILVKMYENKKKKTEEKEIKADPFKTKKW